MSSRRVVGKPYVNIRMESLPRRVSLLLLFQGLRYLCTSDSGFRVVNCPHHIHLQESIAELIFYSLLEFSSIIIGLHINLPSPSPLQMYLRSTSGPSMIHLRFYQHAQKRILFFFLCKAIPAHSHPHACGEHCWDGLWVGKSGCAKFADLVLDFVFSLLACQPVAWPYARHNGIVAH